MPVHLKGGTVDALLYRTTMGLTVVGEKIFLFLKPIGFFSCRISLKVELTGGGGGK